MIEQFFKTDHKTIGIFLSPNSIQSILEALNLSNKPLTDLSFIQKIKIISEIVQSIGIGLGALFGGLGGLILFLDWRKRKIKENFIKNLKLKYPRTSSKSDFRLVDTKKHKGWVFILDNRDNKRHWVSNPETLKGLGYSFSDVQTVSQRDFNKYPEGEEILI